ALKNENCYLLVAPSNGINVWCASSSGEMNTHSIITVIKTSRINERVSHRLMILPQFSATRVDRGLLKQSSGWSSVWGPAYAKDIPSFLASGNKKTQEQSVAKYPLGFRLEMLLSLNFLMWALAGVILLIINPRLLLFASVLFWGVGVILYGGYNILPGNSGWLKAFFLSMLMVVIIALFSFFALGVSPWFYWGWMVTALAVSMSQGLDVKGSVGGNTSEPEHLFYKLGIKSFGHLFSSDGVRNGVVKQDMHRCNGCQTCIFVCPKGVFGFSGGQNEIAPINQEECFACNACVTQCPQNALSIG
nr:4Fe-4S dicluster domain-containing protein [Candidatus Aminicenantes bacterium]